MLILLNGTVSDIIRIFKKWWTKKKKKDESRLDIWEAEKGARKRKLKKQKSWFDKIK